jgi:Fe-S-cluster-containing dehydrogenase component/formate-dependent nitrite reductase membrane component NrfD
LRYGFVIDHNRCIGCHACTVACKEEHNVPVGVFRTWVKYIEKGEFPNVSRHFGVMRCNHCDDAPCVEICPTTALFRREDGIVDFDSTRCIGCQSCMQACPYDALYLDPNSHTAAKCNFCAHRIEMQLEPSCVNVCPTRAIIAGDIDNPQSNIARIIAAGKVAARKPNKGTRPKLFYAGIEGDFLQPSMMLAQPTQMFAEHQPGQQPRPTVSRKQSGQELHRTGAKPAMHIPGAARTVYDVAHPQPWGAIPAFYLWTKSIAAGVAIVAALIFGIFGPLNSIPGGPLLFNLMVPAAALLFTAVTTLLLIADLHRPDRFYYILLKPNPRSWLVIGTWILILYSILAVSWLVCGIGIASSVPALIVALAAIAGACTACYSAFLFAQAKGRDLWQSPLFLWHLLMQALIAGSATIILLVAIGRFSQPNHLAQSGRVVLQMDNSILFGTLLVSALMILGELFLTPFSAEAEYGAQVIIRGHLSGRFWLGAMAVGTIIPAALLLYMILAGTPSLSLELPAAILALLGLLIFENVWIEAGQAAPLS